MLKTSNLKKILPIIFSIVIFSGCNFYKPVKIGEIQSMKLETVSSEGILFKLIIPINNPNSYSIKILKYETDIQINSQKLGKIYSSENINIKAHSEMQYEFPVKIKFDNILSSFSVGLISAFNQKNVNVKISGKVKVRALAISKTFDFEQNKSINILKQ